MLDLDILKKTVGQIIDILFALPERRDMDREHRNTVIEILTKLLLFDILEQVDIAGTDHPHIGIDLLGAADPSELILLKDTKKFCLKLIVHLGDFIQKQGTALCRLKKACLAALLGACKCTVFITKQFALQHGLAEGCAVDGHKGA